MSSVADLPAVTDSLGAVGLRIGFPPEPVCALGVDRYEEMIRAGIIGEDDPVELLDGWMVPKMTKNPRHVLVSELLRDALEKVLLDGWHICSQQPVRLATSMPEPDLMVVRGQRREYRERLPQGEDLGLVVEVSDAGLARDQVLKKAIYAQAGIPVYWVVNLMESRIEAYSAPRAGKAETADYADREYFSLADAIPLVLDGRPMAVIAVRDLLE
jgi:Uma2 family endonuclease